MNRIGHVVHIILLNILLNCSIDCTVLNDEGLNTFFLALLFYNWSKTDHNSSLCVKFQ